MRTITSVSVDTYERDVRWYAARYLAIVCQQYAAKAHKTAARLVRLHAQAATHTADVAVLLANAARYQREAAAWHEMACKLLDDMEACR